LLDQVILQKKRILFRVDNKVFDVPYLFDQTARFVAVVFFVEIGGNTTLQILCFAYIDDRSLLVKVLVAARRFRYDGKDVLYMFLGRAHFFLLIFLSYFQSFTLLLLK
jgi:hypothetical protein